MNSTLLVALQFLLTGALALAGPLRGLPPGFWAGAGAAALLGGWAVAGMRRSRLRIRPEVAPGATLVTGGPYRWIRHPMYTAVLLLAASLTAAGFTPARGALWLALLAVLAMKLRKEERLLAARFPEYADYARRTWRLLPGVW